MRYETGEAVLDSFPIWMLTQDLKQRAIVLKEFNPLD